MSEQVLVETNWVVDVVAPALSRNPDAARLLERARRGEIALHLPAICLVEARKVIRERRIRADLDTIRAFVRDRRNAGDIDDTTANGAWDVLSRFQQYVDDERSQAPNRLTALAADPAVAVFPLDETMLARSLDLASDVAVNLKPFDLSILAGVLVQAARLRANGDNVSFCTLDADLQPWDRNGRRNDLADRFDEAGVWVFGDFLMSNPLRPDNWPT